MEPTPGPTSAFDLNQALLQSREQARAQWAEGLAQFQSQMAAIAETSMQEVVQAAAPAFALGFSFSAQKLINDESHVGVDAISVEDAGAGSWACGGRA